MTRASVGFVCTTITLDGTETRRALGYEPPYTYRSSFEEIARDAPPSDS